MDYRKLEQNIRSVFRIKCALFKEFDSSPISVPINKTQERVLMIVWHHKSAQMQFLSAEVGLEKGSLTTVIDALERLDLVKRVRDGEDRRSITVCATPTGERVAEEIETLFLAHLERVCAKLTPEDRGEFAQAAETFARIMYTLAP